MGAREFTDEAERARRRELVRRVGDAAYGKRLGRQGEDGHKGVWHADFALAIEAATGRAIGRARVSQWLLTGDDAKPVPMWVMDALPAIARAAAADLRRRAESLDALEDEIEGGPPPAADGKPETEGEPPQESGSDAAQASDDAEVDIDDLVVLACSTPSPYAEPPEPAPERTGWRTDFADARGYKLYVPPKKITPPIPDERAFLV